MGLSNKTASKWGLVSVFVAISTAAVAEANRVARDPNVGPAAHTASFIAVLGVWSNWITAVLAAPLALACLLYYAAVLYESKMLKDLVVCWRERRVFSRKAAVVATAAKVDAAAVAQAAKTDAVVVAAEVEASRVEVAAKVEAKRISKENR